MKKLAFILFLVIFVPTTFLMAQDATDLLWDYTVNKYPEALLHKRNLDFKLLTSPNTARNESDYLVIPVVFHIIHSPNTPIGDGENLKKEKLVEQMDILNKCFAGEYGDKSPAKYPSVDTKIRFCFAKTTPEGKPTSGIVRVASNLLPFNVDGGAANTIGSGDRLIKQASKAWNPQKYLNIYITSFTDPRLSGYANFPFFSPIWYVESDGVVMSHRFIGRYPISYPNFLQNEGRSLAHEIGHWLGLFHLTQIQKDIGMPVLSNPCTEIPELCLDLGDKVCDTPPQNVLDISESQCFEMLVCEQYSTRRVVSVQNFMNYHKKELCTKSFTQGQADRMWRVIVTSRPGLLQGGGRGDDAPVAGGRTEGCTTCETCKPITPKIIGNDIACDGEIVTYKLDAAEPYGCDVFWQVRGGTFIDYNGALGITIPYGTNLFIDSIRVKWNSIGAVHELLAIVNRCDNVDAQSLGTIATKKVTIRPFKPLTFKNPTA